MHCSIRIRCRIVATQVARPRSPAIPAKSAALVREGRLLIWNPHGRNVLGTGRALHCGDRCERELARAAGSLGRSVPAGVAADRAVCSGLRRCCWSGCGAVGNCEPRSVAGDRRHPVRSRRLRRGETAAAQPDRLDSARADARVPPLGRRRERTPSCTTTEATASCRWPGSVPFSLRCGSGCFCSCRCRSRSSPTVACRDDGAGWSARISQAAASSSPRPPGRM